LDGDGTAFDLFAAIVHRTGIGIEQADDDVENRGLAAAAGADNADEVALVDVKAEVVEHSDLASLAGKGLSDVSNAQLDGAWAALSGHTQLVSQAVA
jgi:hypothetical protein